LICVTVFVMLFNPFQEEWSGDNEGAESVDHNKFPL